MLVIRKGEIRDKKEAGWIEKENGDETDGEQGITRRNYAILIKYQMLRKINNLRLTSTRMTPRLRVS